ncbi:hypothetical protein CYMTET_29358 [Cymbomonas tetramitiformis]|uniref:Uncharacterized protein n=1 Tax=Cymbomonas tetramitiformis TaxID=36881 RepID=A0AAE0FL79_9CHLO|nr:hypothetical protein CYMTET_29358 [Cymbomonas tetramitiformis]
MPIVRNRRLSSGAAGATAQPHSSASVVAAAVSGNALQSPPCSAQGVISPRAAMGGGGNSAARDGRRQPVRSGSGITAATRRATGAIATAATATAARVNEETAPNATGNDAGGAAAAVPPSINEARAFPRVINFLTPDLSTRSNNTFYRQDPTTRVWALRDLALAMVEEVPPTQMRHLEFQPR